MKGVVMVMAVLAVIQLMVQPGQAISCGQVDGYLAPCAPYLIGGSGSPAPTCCDEVKNIKGMASTTADKRAACNCIKQAANRYWNLKDDAAQSLAANCGVQMDIPVSRTTNCDMKDEGSSHSDGCASHDPAHGRAKPGHLLWPGMASTTADNRAACNCVKQAANRCSNLKDDAAQSLAAKCGVQMDIPVSPDHQL
ncbi:hypothetical protein ACSBR2_017027 [Camellia fascicularis]